MTNICARCGGSPVRDNLDGEDLCQPCCDAWARAEAPDPEPWMKPEVRKLAPPPPDTFEPENEA
jgi:hypothetical protein